MEEEQTEEQTEEQKIIGYSTWRTTTGSWGYVAVYQDHTGTWTKTVYNGVVMSYEQIEGAPA